MSPVFQPFGFAGGQGNLYVFVGNDPVNWVDPTDDTASVRDISPDLGVWFSSYQSFKEFFTICTKWILNQEQGGL